MIRLQSPPPPPPCTVLDLQLNSRWQQEFWRRGTCVRQRQRCRDTETLMGTRATVLGEKQRGGVGQSGSFGIFCRKCYCHVFVITSFLCLHGALAEICLALPTFPTEAVFLLESSHARLGRSAPGRYNAQNRAHNFRPSQCLQGQISQLFALLLSLQ